MVWTGEPSFNRKTKQPGESLAVFFPKNVFFVFVFARESWFLIGRAQCCRGVRADVEPERIVWHVLLKCQFIVGSL